MNIRLYIHFCGNLGKSKLSRLHLQHKERLNVLKNSLWIMGQRVSCVKYIAGMGNDTPVSSTHDFEATRLDRYCSVFFFWIAIWQNNRCLISLIVLDLTWRKSSVEPCVINCPSFHFCYWPLVVEKLSWLQKESKFQRKESGI